MVRVPLVWPEMAVPIPVLPTAFLYHCRAGVGMPVAPELKTAVAPTFTVVLVGCGVMTGGTMTVNGTLLAPLGATLTGGTLKGTGTIQGNLTNRRQFDCASPVEHQ